MATAEVLSPTQSVIASSGRLRTKSSASPPTSAYWKGDTDVIERPWSEEASSMTECFSTTIRASPKEIFNKLLHGHSGKSFLRKYHLGIGDLDPITVGEWARDPSASPYPYRKVEFVHPIAYKIGPSQTKVVETQYYSFTLSDGFVFEAEGHNVDVPYSSQFRIHSMFKVEPVAGEENESVLVASVTTHFIKKPVGIWKIIEKGTVDDCKVAYEKFCVIAKSFCEGGGGGDDSVATTTAKLQMHSQPVATHIPSTKVSEPEKESVMDMEPARRATGNIQPLPGKLILNDSLMLGSYSGTDFLTGLNNTASKEPLMPIVSYEILGFDGNRFLQSVLVLIFLLLVMILALSSSVVSDLENRLMAVQRIHRMS